MKILVTPVFDEELVDMIDRTGEALSSLARTLRRLNDGSPDTMRSTPDRLIVPDGHAGICPYVITKSPHVPHRFQVDTDTSKIGAEILSFDCPGYPNLSSR